MIQLNAVPEELRQLDQWVAWRYLMVADKPKPTKPPINIRSGVICNPLDPKNWSSFADVAAVAKNYDGVGFVLSESDPFCCIDFDAHVDPAIQKKQIEVANSFKSYAETSPSGNGLHIICRGRIPNSIQSDWIEIYSQNQYITITGNIWNNRTKILDEDPRVQEIYRQYVTSKNKKDDGEVREQEQQYTDQEIYDMAANSAAGLKFISTWAGHWQGLYPSASECRLALMNYLVFYSGNREQCYRMFLQSGIAKHPKFAGRNDKQKELDRMFKKGFDQDLPFVKIDFLKDQMQKIVEEEKQKRLEIGEKIEASRQELIQSSDSRITVVDDPRTKTPSSSYTIPTGLTGEIADYLFKQSRKPIPEASIVAALGLMAGMCGRAYNTYTSLGCNLYLLLLAETAVGKEGPIRGISKIKASLKMLSPEFDQMIGPNFASGQALVSYLQDSSCFVSIMDEFGKLWGRMASRRASSADKELIRVMLEVYTKSDAHSEFAAKVYSSSERSMPIIKSPSFSFIGFSTPESFYDSLQDISIEDGFLPRLLMVHYKGGRPASNRLHNEIEPSESMLANIATLANAALQANRQDLSTRVPIMDQALSIADDYEDTIDKHINSSTSEIARQLWSRAHANVLKIATLIAIGDNIFNPCVSVGNIEYAMKVVNQNISDINDQFAGGAFGTNSLIIRQQKDLVKKIVEFATAPAEKLTDSYLNVTPACAADRVIPYGFFHKKLTGVSSFRKDPRNPNDALKKAIQIACENGDLMELLGPQFVKKYGCAGRLFAIANPDIIRQMAQL